MASAKFMRDCAPIAILTIGGAQVARVECAQCGVKYEWTYPTRIPPEGIKKYFNSHGWSLRNRITCPDCMKSKKERKPMTTATPNDAPNPKVVMKNTLTVMQALEEYYDPKVKRYRDGKSDRALADELRFSVEFVASVREELHGQMAEPQEIADLRGEISKALSEVSKLQVKLSELCKRNGWAV